MERAPAAIAFSLGIRLARACLSFTQSGSMAFLLWPGRKMGEDAGPSCARQAALGLGNPHPRRSPLDQEIRIEFTRFSAFYSPLIATMAGGFLEKEGLEARHAVSAPGRTAIASLL